MLAIQDDDYHTVSQTLNQIITFKNSSFVLDSYHQDRLKAAELLASKNDFVSAQAITEVMNDYEPAVVATKKYINWQTYRLAESYIDKDDYNATVKTLTSLGNFEDSKERLAAYQADRVARAYAASDLKDYKTAYEILSVMNGVDIADKALYEIQQRDFLDQFHTAIDNFEYNKVLSLEKILIKMFPKKSTIFRISCFLYYLSVSISYRRS